MKTTYTYQQNELGAWTAGYRRPDGTWDTESFHGSPAEAAARVHWLNGGSVDPAAAGEPSESKDLATYRQHSITLNAVAYRIAEALSEHKDEEHYVGNPVEQAERIIAERDRAIRTRDAVADTVTELKASHVAELAEAVRYATMLEATVKELRQFDRRPYAGEPAVELHEAELFEQWAILELMGHRRIAGHVREAQVAGAGMLRVDIPAAGENPAVTQYVSPASVYAIHPTTEAIATGAASSWRTPLVTRFELDAAHTVDAVSHGQGDGACSTCHEGDCDIHPF